MELAALNEAFDHLNAQQREAVECLDGPLLVIAGPGTGKTQLLSLRAANILAKRDALPGNILCLTYTEAGAEAMRKRLIELVGRDAYGIQVSTFHGFASSMKSRYAQYFDRSASDALITTLQQKELFDKLLKSLPFGAPLSAGTPQGVSFYIDAMVGFVSKAKRSGVSYEVLARIAQQNLDAAQWLARHSTLLELAAEKASASLAERFEAEVERACAMAPRELKQPIVSTPGIYVPYIMHLLDSVRRTELVDERGKTGGYAEIRKAFFGGTNKDGRTFKVVEGSERLACACEVARRYQKELDTLGLYDYDDMIYDFVHAVERNADFKQALQDAYTYIQVDEFQDTNGAQMRIVELLCDGVEHPNVMAVGDDDQAIMRFQGASIDCINQFVDAYRPHSVVLKTNYRSTPAIVALGGKIAAQIERRLDASDGKTLAAFKPDGDQTEFAECCFASKPEEFAALAADVRSKIDAGYIESCADADEAIAVIAPKHAALRALIPYFVRENIPFAYRERQNLFKLKQMQTMLALVRCVVALAQGREALAASFVPAIVSSPEFGGDHASSVRFALHARRECYGDWVRAMRETDDARIRGIRDDLMGWAARTYSTPVRELLFDMASRSLGYYRATDDALAAVRFNAGMRALVSFVEGELEGSRALGRAVRLPDIVDRLDAAQRYGMSVDASVDMGEAGAVRLTSAHSSKGLEFDCVYLVDADDATWHKGATGGGLYPANMLIHDEKDADDARRLLFVAATRAKRHLAMYRAGGATLQELSGIVSTCEVASSVSGVDLALETDWRDNFRLDTPQLMGLVDGRRDVRTLSATALNAFVEYQLGCLSSARFPEANIVRLPEAPSISLEFGTLAHAMLEDVVNRVMGRQGVGLAEVEAPFRARVARLDFPPEDAAKYVERFDRVCRTFVPWLMEHAARYRRIAEARFCVATRGGTPLSGYLDLLLVDDASKTVRIVDYKTGFDEKVPDGYKRQLRFYKLMVERSPEFAGYTVKSMGDFYIEPDKKSNAVREPFAISASAEEICQLERLVDAVWHRIQQGQWDTSAFEQSERYAEAVAEREHVRSKADKASIMQRAYEQWLIENDDR